MGFSSGFVDADADSLSSLSVFLPFLALVAFGLAAGESLALWVSFSFVLGVFAGYPSC
jgi:hypothetical protein